MNHQRILVLGASGGCGQWAVRLAADRGHEVTAVVRPATEYSVPDGVLVERGEVTDPAFVRDALAGHHTVISCLGLRRASKSPWSRLLSPPDLVQRVTENVINGMTSPEGVRFIWISAGGVGSSLAQTTRAVKMLIRAGNIGVAYRDLEAAEVMLEGSGVNSLPVRPVTLISGRPAGRAGATQRYGFFSMIRRSDVAQWMLDVADGEKAYEGSDVLLGKHSTTRMNCL